MDHKRSAWKSRLLIIVSLFHESRLANNNKPIPLRKIDKDSYSHIKNPQGLLNNSDDNFHTGTPYLKELIKLTLFIFLKHELEIGREAR